jgi:Family of unknown function (DUF6364)
MPKNITLSVDEDVLQRARVVAAIRKTSVSELVRGFLARLTEIAVRLDCTLLHLAAKTSGVSDNMVQSKRGLAPCSAKRIGGYNPQLC